MPPQMQQNSWVLYETDATTEDGDVTDTVEPIAEKRTFKIVWMNVIIVVILHIAAVYGFYLFLFKAMWLTNLFALFLYLCSTLGVTAGAHRLWAHKSYKAKLPLRLLLTLFNTIAFQAPVVNWAREHRMHHKYSETDADPHNATRGFFFSHIGWLLVRKHPQIKAKGQDIDMSDLMADPILRFQKKYYLLLVSLLCFVMPTYVPTLWDESAWNAYFVCATFRYILLLNATCLVNSVAHLWGNKPYDKNINPVEIKPLSLVVLGEGFHNYHHTFPWDYKASELGDYSLNISKLFIDFMAKIGWAYDLKTISVDMIQKRVKRTGDGSHPVWGWDDKDVPTEDIQVTLIVPNKDGPTRKETMQNQ